MQLMGGRYAPQWRLPIRNISIPDAYNFTLRASKFVKECGKTPHRVLTMSEEASGAFLGYQTYYNIQVKKARDACVKEEYR